MAADQTQAFQTLRVKRGTFSTEHVAPDGSHRFPPGLIVPVGEGGGSVDEDTAKRWVRVGIAEPFRGAPGTSVSDQDAAMTPEQLEAQIATLQALHARATGQEPPPQTRISRAHAPGVEAQLPPDQPIGHAVYSDPDGPSWLDQYDLADKQRAALLRAGFTRPEHVERATDAELLEVDGIGVGTLQKLRGGRD